MAEANKLSKSGLTRGKAIVIGVLSIVLIAVLYLQFGGGGSDESSDGAASKYRPPRPAVAVQPTNETARPVTLAATKATTSSPAGKGKEQAGAPSINESHWKSPELTKVIAYDPFALPPTFPQPPKANVGAKGGGSDAIIAAASADDAKRQAEAVDQLRMQMEVLIQQGVHVIIPEGDHYVAVIGDRTLHVGDMIDDFTIIAIDPDDPAGPVLIEKKDAP